MDEVRQTAPRAWSLQRDFTLTGMPGAPSLASPMFAGIVREQETRRVTAVTPTADGYVLRIEDFLGHAQYGIASNRPLSPDYHPGDEVMIVDPQQTAYAKVVSVDDARREVRVHKFDMPKGGFRLEYSSAVPTKEDSTAPGLFPPGGCLLMKFKPGGTPKYFWKRLDLEWDLAHKRFGRRLMPNFVDAPGDLSRDGRNWTTAKDYVQLHAVTREITAHIIDRYGDAALEWPWAVFNEPDLQVLFWRSDWKELMTFYDYSVDAILRTFEEKGYDSSKVQIGGLELAGIFGENLRLADFLEHCSPLANAKEKYPLNAAFADARLNGKRSRRVEELCRANAGRGAPCDFVSVHSYNTSELMFRKLKRAKQMALEIDADFYTRLWVNSHESCPEWAGPPDPAFGDSYLGNGYFPTWCADVARRQLQQATNDSRYAYGESILTFWPWPNSDVGGGNAATRVFRIDEDGDGKQDREESIAMPILHFLGQLSQMGDSFWVFPEHKAGGHVVSGFASRESDRLRVLLYSHDAVDTESRSEQSFEATVPVEGLAPGTYTVTEYRFDKGHNSYFHTARELRDGPERKREQERIALQSQIADAARELRDSDPAVRLSAIDQIKEFGAAASDLVPTLVDLAQNDADDAVKQAAIGVIWGLHGKRVFSAETFSGIKQQSILRHTAQRTVRVVNGADGRLELRVELSATGANFLVVERVK